MSNTKESFAKIYKARYNLLNLIELLEAGLITFDKHKNHEVSIKVLPRDGMVHRYEGPGGSIFANKEQLQVFLDTLKLEGIEQILQYKKEVIEELDAIKKSMDSLEAELKKLKSKECNKEE